MIGILINKFNNLRMIYKVLIIIAIILIVLLSIGLMIKSDPKDKVRNYIVSQGYNNEDGGSYYYKLISIYDLDEYNKNVNNKVNSFYEINYLDINNFDFKKNSREYINGMSSLLNLNFELEVDRITFNYRVSLDDNATAIFSGEYFVPQDYFRCDKEYSNNIKTSDDDEVICSRIKDDITNFQTEVYDLFSDNILKIIKS